MSVTNTPLSARVAHTIGLVADPELHGVEKASSSYLIGAMLIDDDAGRITESTTPIDASTVAKRTFGVALDPATGVTGADVRFAWVGPYTVLEMTLSDGTAGTHTLAQADQWKVYPILKATHWYLDANAVSDTGGGIVVGFKDAIGTVDARVYVIVSNTARGGANAGSGTF
jgi:hypothetical protein